jgi:hypothetical protein
VPRCKLARFVGIERSIEKMTRIGGHEPWSAGPPSSTYLRSQ